MEAEALAVTSTGACPLAGVALRAAVGGWAGAVLGWNS